MEWWRAQKMRFWAICVCQGGNCRFLGQSMFSLLSFTKTPYLPRSLPKAQSLGRCDPMSYSMSSLKCCPLLFSYLFVLYSFKHREPKKPKGSGVIYSAADLVRSYDRQCWNKHLGRGSQEWFPPGWAMVLKLGEYCVGYVLLCFASAITWGKSRTCMPACNQVGTPSWALSLWKIA